MNHLSIKKFIPGIAWFFVVLILLCLPGNDIPQPDSWFQIYYVDKIVHLCLFGLLAYLFLLPIAGSGFTEKQKVHYLIKISLAASLWGLTTEFIQRFYINGRSFDLLDWAADTAGIAFALYYSFSKMKKNMNNILPNSKY